MYHYIIGTIFRALGVDFFFLDVKSIGTWVGSWGSCYNSSIINMREFEALPPGYTFS